MRSPNEIRANALLTALGQAVQHDRGCPLYHSTTQAVFGDVARRARLVLLGEQTGSQEDIDGKLFVGSAG